jgi:hypothetical protein
MKSKAFRNPTIYKTLVEFVDVDERRGVGNGIWEWNEGERKAWSAIRICTSPLLWSSRVQSRGVDDGLGLEGKEGVRGGKRKTLSS